MRVLQKRRLTESKAEPKVEEDPGEDGEEAEAGGGACGGGISSCCGCGVKKERKKERKPRDTIAFSQSSSVVASLFVLHHSL